jgi:hypothetical protein
MATAGTDRLETGWLPTTPLGDTLIHDFVIHHAECIASVAAAHDRRVLRRPDAVAADLGRPSGFFNGAVLLQPLDAGSTVVSDLESWYRREGRGEVLLWSAWPTPDLTARGWRLEGHPPLMIRPPGGPLPPAGRDVTVRRVARDTHLDDFCRIVVDGFPLPELQPYGSAALIDRRLLRDARWQLWLAEIAGRPVGAAALFVEHGLAQLSLAATLPAARGRGAWYALVRARLQAAARLISAGIFSDDSRPGIARLDYLPITRLTLWRLPR